MHPRLLLPHSACKNALTMQGSICYYHNFDTTPPFVKFAAYRALQANRMFIIRSNHFWVDAVPTQIAAGE